VVSGFCTIVPATQIL